MATRAFPTGFFWSLLVHTLYGFMAEPDELEAVRVRQVLKTSSSSCLGLTARVIGRWYRYRRSAARVDLDGNVAAADAADNVEGERELGLRPGCGTTFTYTRTTGERE